MKKLSMKLEELHVESFGTCETAGERGTVEAHGPHTDPRYCAPSDNWYCSVGDGCTRAEYTCAWTCGEDCFSDNDYSCNPTVCP